MREMSVAEQRYKAVLAVVADGRTITRSQRPGGSRVSRRTRVADRHPQAGLDGLVHRSYRPEHSPAQMAAELDVAMRC
jgi:hypothetical protein